MTYRNKIKKGHFNKTVVLTPADYCVSSLQGLADDSSFSCRRLWEMSSPPCHMKYNEDAAGGASSGPVDPTKGKFRFS